MNDTTRPVSNTRYNVDAASFVDIETYHLFRGYRRDLLQSQHDHIEIAAEKLTVQRILQPVADKYCVPMTIGRGYCSLEPRRQMVRDRAKRKGSIDCVDRVRPRPGWNDDLRIVCAVDP